MSPNESLNEHLEKHLIVAASVCHTDMDKSEKLENSLAHSIAIEAFNHSYDVDYPTLTYLLRTSGPTCSIDNLWRTADTLGQMARNGYRVHVVFIVAPDEIISQTVFIYALFLAKLELQSVHIFVPLQGDGSLPHFPQYMKDASILSYAPENFNKSAFFEDAAKRLFDTIHHYHPFHPPVPRQEFIRILQETNRREILNKSYIEPLTTFQKSPDWDETSSENWTKPDKYQRFLAFKLIQGVTTIQDIVEQDPQTYSLLEKQRPGFLADIQAIQAQATNLLLSSGNSDDMRKLKS